jgi:Domain of unknown function (DUF4253)
MIDSPDEISELLRNTILAGCEVVSIRVLDTVDTAIAVKINVDHIEESWKVARNLLARTERWPIVSTTWGGGGGSFREALEESQLFSRFYYEEAPDNKDVSPEAIIAKSATVDVEAFLKRLDVEYAEQYEGGWADAWIEDELQRCEQEIGRRPKDEELNSEISAKPTQIDRWMFEQQIAKDALPPPEPTPFQWFDPDNAYLLLLPTMSGWESLAYEHFFGAQEGSEYYIALGKSWEERFGAELMAHYGTMLQCYASKPPTDPLVAWQLAREHDMAAGSTLAPAGVYIRQYAGVLMSHDRWFLHDRP